MLTLVFMKPLHLDVEQRVWIDGDPRAPGSKPRGLVCFPFNHSPLFLETQVADRGFETSQFLEILDPSLADSLLMRRLSFGLLSTMNRRGVTPLVTLVNFSGVHS